MMQHCDYQEQERSLSDAWELVQRSPREYAENAIWRQARPDDVESTNSRFWLEGHRKTSESIIHDRWQINKSFQRRIGDLVRRSKLLQDLKDEEGHPIITRASLDRSLEFLKDLFKQALEEFSVEINIPEILPGPDQSVDILWDFPNYELLVNVPANAIAPPTYYGDNRGENITRGSISTPENARMVGVWLICLKQ